MEEGLDEFFEGVKMALDPCYIWCKTSSKRRNEVLTPGLAWSV